MTCILGLRDRGVSYIAADSASTAYDYRIPSTTQKITVAGGWIIGTSGPGRYRIVVEENRERLAVATDIQRLTREMRALVKEDGFQAESSRCGPERLGEMCAIVGSEDGVWHVGDDFSYAELDEGCVWGCGSGAPYGEGATQAFLESGWSPSEALARGMTIAARYDPAGTGDRAQMRCVGAVTGMSISEGIP